VNLQEWIQYRRTCPLCQGTLSTYLHSTKKQGIRIEDGRLVITFPMHELNKQAKYIVGYSFDLYKNSFLIDFYDKNNTRLEKETPNFLMDKFRKFDTNLGHYSFYRCCTTCRRYHYTSTDFKFNFKTATLSAELDVSTEYFGFVQLLKNSNEKPYRIFRLLNFCPQDKCSLSYWSSDYPEGTNPNFNIPSYAEHIYLPLIRFVSLEETLNRLKKLLVFC
jgi:hypothetical protein